MRKQRQAACSSSSPRRRHTARAAAPIDRRYCCWKLAGWACIATLVQEKNFSSIYQQGENYSLLVVDVDEHCLLTVIFKANLSVGAIKYYATDIVRRIAMALQIAESRDPGAGLDLSMLNMADPSPLFRRKSV